MRCGKSWDEGESNYVSVLHFQEDSPEPLRLHRREGFAFPICSARTGISKK